MLPLQSHLLLPLMAVLLSFAVQKAQPSPVGPRGDESPPSPSATLSDEEIAWLRASMGSSGAGSSGASPRFPLNSQRQPHGTTNFNSLESLPLLHQDPRSFGNVPGTFYRSHDGLRPAPFFFPGPLQDVHPPVQDMHATFPGIYHPVRLLPSGAAGPSRVFNDILGTSQSSDVDRSTSSHDRHTVPSEGAHLIPTSDTALNSLPDRLTGFSMPTMRVFNFDSEIRQEWLRKLKEAIGTEKLHIAPSDHDDSKKQRVFLAHDNDEVQGYYPPTGPNGLADPSEHKHFLSRFSDIRSVDTDHFPRGTHLSRVFVYYNSRRKLDLINREYFLGRLTFLPIRTEKLTRNALNKIHWERSVQFVLPPIHENGYSLIVTRMQTPRLNRHVITESITGHATSRQLVSIWSPVLYDGTRNTAVLYGIGQFDPLFTRALHEHWRNLQRNTPSDKYSPIYGSSEVMQLVKDKVHI